jgi:Uma2 family endonuclease
VEAEVPESKRHLELRTILYLLLKQGFADRAIVGSDQFVYWDPTDPRQCLAPAGLLQMGKPDEDYETWKVWERGAPDIAVEIVSRSDAPEPDWDEKLAKYRKIGLKELVRFDHRPVRNALRIWDNVEGDLVERDMSDPEARQSLVLPYFWHVTADRTLRLAEDAEGARLLPTPQERAESEAQRADSAESEVARLRAELARLQGKG